MAYPAPIISTITIVFYPHRPVTGPGLPSTHHLYHHHCLLPTPPSHWPCLLQHPSSLPSPLSPSHTVFSLALPSPAPIVTTITTVSFPHRFLTDPAFPSIYRLDHHQCLSAPSFAHWLARPVRQRNHFMVTPSWSRVLRPRVASLGLAPITVLVLRTTRILLSILIVHTSQEKPFGFESPVEVLNPFLGLSAMCLEYRSLNYDFWSRP